MQTKATKYWHIVAIVVITMLAAGQNTAIAQPRVATMDAPHTEDEVLISVPLAATQDEVMSLLQSTGLSSIEPEEVELLTEGVASIPVAKDATVEQAIEELELSEVVESVQPDYLYRIMDDEPSFLELLESTNNTVRTPDDPLLVNSWGLQSIDAPAAWDLAYAQGAHTKVGVALMDAGFAVEHEDLKSNIAQGAPYNAYYASLGKEGEELRDVAPGPSSTAHGTHVAGIVAAVGNNATGIAGVSYEAQIVPIRVYNYETGNSAGATTAAMIKAYDYVINNKDAFNIRVVSMSLGVAFSAPFSSDDLLLNAIDDAFEQGIITVASAGNNASSGPYDCYPGDYDTVVSVINLQTSSTIASDGNLVFDDAKAVNRAASSNRNASGERDKNISAPGTRILSTSTSESYGFGPYGYLSGTSMACPFVAGTLALMFSVAPNLDAQTAVDVLYASARDIGATGWDEEYGYGEVNAHAAVKAIIDGTYEGDPCEPVKPADGWTNLLDGAKGYLHNGSLVTGWMDLNGAKYWFDQNGAMATGWTDLVVDDAVMHYYFRPSGNLARDAWATIDGDKYYFRPSGNLAIGWATINDNGVQKKYYFDDDGRMVTGWREIEVGSGYNRYYFRPSGSMATGWADIDGQKYYFRPSGSMATGFADVPEDPYKRFFNEDGHMLIGWQNIGENRYYFRPSGAMQTGEAFIDGVAYAFTDNGVLR